MYIQRNRSKYKSGKGYRSILLCKKYRQDGKIKAKTLANLSHLIKMSPLRKIFFTAKDAKNPQDSQRALFFFIFFYYLCKN